MLLTVTLFTPTTQLRRDTMFNLSGIETVYAPPWTGSGLLQVCRVNEVNQTREGESCVEPVDPQ